MRTKNLILCFRHKALIDNELCNTFCGLGDIIRGFIHCFLLCKHFNLKFYLNFDGHILKNFVKINSFIDFKGEKPNAIPFIEGNDIEKFIYNSNNENVFLMTSGDFNLNFQYSGILKSAFIEIFLSNKLIKKKIQENFSSCKNVFHARFGDDKITSKDFLDNFYLKDGKHAYSPTSWARLSTTASKYECVSNFFSNSINNFDYVCSDHFGFKQHLKSLININFNDSEPCHVGLEFENEDSITNTLLDFYILFFSEKIVSVGSYPYGKRPSGFAFWPSFFNQIDCSFYSFDFFRLEIKKLET